MFSRFLCICFGCTSSLSLFQHQTQPFKLKQFTLNSSVNITRFQLSKVQSILSLHQRRRSLALSSLMSGFFTLGKAPKPLFLRALRTVSALTLILRLCESSSLVFIALPKPPLAIFCTQHLLFSIVSFYGRPPLAFFGQDKLFFQYHIRWLC